MAATRFTEAAPSANLWGYQTARVILAHLVGALISAMEQLRRCCGLVGRTAEFGLPQSALGLNASRCRSLPQICFMAQRDVLGGDWRDPWSDLLIRLRLLGVS